MTNINLTAEGKRFTMEIDGHTNYGAHGSDILCASVSILAQTFILYAQEMEADAEAVIETLEKEPGHIKMIAKGKLNNAFTMLSIGMWALAMQYPDYISVGKKSK